MHELSQILIDATAAIEAPYFQLPIYGGPPVYRERVYCYELYHQMRVRWPSKNETPYLLNGEVDKRAHRALEEIGVTGQKPDLLVHLPGDLEGNFAIIEVKHVDANAEGIQKDLTTLALFSTKVGYHRAIYLIYGLGVDADFVSRIMQAAVDLKDTKGIEIWLHFEQGTPARHVASLL